jgi:hypothetical protein
VLPQTWATKSVVINLARLGMRPDVAVGEVMGGVGP